jgi:hypothetical protein
MLPVRSPRFLFRLGLSLMLSAGCAMTLAVMSIYSSSRPMGVAQIGPPTTREATRFLRSATWGPTSNLIGYVQTIGFQRFLDEQFQAPASSYPTLPLVPSTVPSECDATCRRDNYSLYPLQNRFFVNALYGSDQLRQRVAFALHQIFVVAGSGIGNHPSRMAPYLAVFASSCTRSR